MQVKKHRTVYAVSLLLAALDEDSDEVVEPDADVSLPDDVDSESLELPFDDVPFDDAVVEALPDERLSVE